MQGVLLNELHNRSAYLARELTIDVGTKSIE